MTPRMQTDAPHQRIVAKFGTNLLTGGTSHLNRPVMSGLVSQIANLRGQGRDLLVVSSGAIAAGRDKLGLTRRVRGIPYRQVLAAAGQPRLMNIYEGLFGEHGLTVAQALLTRADLADRAGYLNARNTLLALIELGVICIVNENDVVAVDEIEGARFGDNDNLSAMAANLIDADLLVMLGDVGGLYTADPNHDPNARLIPEVVRVNAEIESLAADTAGPSGTGGMITKLEAARLATASGVTVVIADGHEPNVLERLVAGESIGTRFLPVSSQVESRKRWMLSGLATRGRLIVDSGAAAALRKQKRSLLPAGVRGCEGHFARGDIVDIRDAEGNQIGSGISNYASADVEVLKGSHSRSIAGILGYDYGSEIVHRNNLVVV